MDIQTITLKIVNSLKGIKGVEAVVLGGSRASGTFNSKSDIDIGIYYNEGSLLDLKELNKVAEELDDLHRLNLITDIGEWGPWINGGGWLTVGEVPTDFLFRDLKKVSSVIDDCINKNITIDYQPGHPHGFVNAIYAAETFFCKVLWEVNDSISNLKKRIIPYPAAIKIGIVNKFLWEAGFFITIVKKGLSRNDIVYTTGCIYRIVSCLIQVLYALNETYIMNEKGALEEIHFFQYQPEDFIYRIEYILGALSQNTEDVKNAVFNLSTITNEVEELCKENIDK
jgi:predicted nucleotidyltransferase